MALALAADTCLSNGLTVQPRVVANRQGRVGTAMAALETPLQALPTV